MFHGWRLQIREAEQALREGRLEDAAKLLQDEHLRKFLPAQKLTSRVATKLAERASDHVLAGDWVSGWKDFENSRRFGGKSSTWHAVRRRIMSTACRELELDLGEGNPVHALSRIEELRKHHCEDDHIRDLDQLARRMLSGSKLARAGRFDDALHQVDEAQKLRPALRVLDALKKTYEEQGAVAKQLTEQLHAALADNEWTTAAGAADEILKMCPDSRLAQDTKQRAWDRVNVRHQSPSTLEVATDRRQNRFILWIDAVGGFLVCLDDEVTIGQAQPHGRHLDIPILADISGQHCKIRRQGDSYILEPLAPVRVNDQAIDSTTLLNDEDKIDLGSDVVLRFRKPHALSASARLEFLSRHRTQLATDSILLMAESCVLGPKWQNHVVCQDWSGDVVLYRHEQDLFCRAMESIEVDGELCDGRARVHPNSHVIGSDFSMSLEEI